MHHKNDISILLMRTHLIITRDSTLQCISFGSIVTNKKNEMSHFMLDKCKPIYENCVITIMIELSAAVFDYYAYIF